MLAEREGDEIFSSMYFFLILHTDRNTTRNKWYIGEKTDRNVFICQTTVSMYV